MSLKRSVMVSPSLVIEQCELQSNNDKLTNKYHLPTIIPFEIFMKAFVGQPFLIQFTAARLRIIKKLCVHGQKSATSSS